MTITLSDLLKDGKVHVLDGAMGTMLYSKGFLLNVCYDELNLKQPKLVQEVHEAYVRAGAEILETNTFGANPLKLKSFGLADETEEMSQAAVRLARAAGAGRASVVGAIGPLGVRIEPFGALARDEACAHFSRQVKGLLAGGVDGFILETFSDVEELHAALRAVQGLSDLPIIAQMTIGDDGLTHYGTGPETFAQQLTEWGADVIGVNCSVGPAGVLEAVGEMVKGTDRPISGAPNAGPPPDRGGRGQRPRRPAGAEPDGRAPVGDPDSKGSGNRDRHPLLLSRPQPARHAVGHPGRARRGTAQHPHHHGRPAQDGAVPRGHGGVRHRLDRAHESRVPAQPRARPRGQTAPRTPALGDRRRRESGRRRPGPRAVALRVEGGRRSGVRRDTAGVRSRAARRVLEARRAVQDPDRGGDLAAHLAPQRRVSRERSTGSLRPRLGARPDAPGAGEGKGSGPRRRREDRPRDVPAGEGERAGCAGERAVRAG